METYNISMDIFKGRLYDLCQSDILQATYKRMSTQQKAAFTRKYNTHLLSSVQKIKSKKSKNYIYIYSDNVEMDELDKVEEKSKLR